MRCDNGPEFVSIALAGWAEDHGIHLDFIKPGKLAVIEATRSLPRQGTGRSPQSGTGPGSRKGKFMRAVSPAMIESAIRASPAPAPIANFSMATTYWNISVTHQLNQFVATLHHSVWAYTVSQDQGPAA